MLCLTCVSSRRDDDDNGIDVGLVRGLDRKLMKTLTQCTGLAIYGDGECSFNCDSTQWYYHKALFGLN